MKAAIYARWYEDSALFDVFGEDWKGNESVVSLPDNALHLLTLLAPLGRFSVYLPGQGNSQEGVEPRNDVDLSLCFENDYD